MASSGKSSGSSAPVLSKQIGANYATPTAPNGGWTTGSGDPVGTMVLHPILLEAGTLDRLSQQDFGANAAGELLRLGLYAPDASGSFPGALLIDGGTIDLGTTAAIKRVTIALAITKGLFFTATVRQGTGNTKAVLISPLGAQNPRELMPHGASGGTNLYDGGGAWIQTGVAGALPANYTGNTQGGASGGSAPAFVRYSA